MNIDHKIKILLLTREFRGVKFGPIDEFKKAGCDVKVITSLVESSKWNILYRIKKRMGMNLEPYIQRKDARFAKGLHKIIREFTPDIIYVWHGTQLREKTIEALKKHCLMVMETADKLEFFPSLYRYAFHYDLFISYNAEDVEYINRNGGNAVFSPAVGNDEVFHFDGRARDIDISFVGQMYPDEFYGDRILVLDQLIEDLPDAKIFVGGKCAPIRRPKKFFHWFLNRRRREVYNNKNISARECNDIYNRSKICLNINRINTGEGWSERFGNIMFTKTLQIVTDNAIIRDTFGDVVETFHDYSELLTKIKKYLGNSELREKKAEEGYVCFIDKVEKIRKEYNIVDMVLKLYIKKNRRNQG